MFYEILLTIALWPVFFGVGYYVGRWTPIRFHHCFQEAKCKLECQTESEAAKIAQELADTRLKTIQELQEKLENVENDFLDFRHGVLPDGDSGIHTGREASRRDSSCPVGRDAASIVERSADDTGSQFRAAFRFQEPFRGQCSRRADCADGS